MIGSIDFARALLVATREYLENVRTRGFWVSILMMPFVLAVIAVAPMLLRNAETEARFAVLDHSGWVQRAVAARVARDDATLLLAALAALGPDARPTALHDVDIPAEPVARAALAHDLGEAVVATGGTESHDGATPAALIAAWWQADPDAVARIAPAVSLAKYRYVAVDGLDRAALNRLLDADALLGYFVIPQDPVAGNGGATYVTRKLVNLDVRRWYESRVNDAVRDRRMRAQNIAPEVAEWIETPVEFVPIRLGAGGVETEAALADTLSQWAPVAFVYLLWISIFSITQMLLTNTIEEKSNRLVEVLLSSVAPVDLMAGKILGIAATGLTIVIAWLCLGIASILWLPGLVGASAGVDLTALIDRPVYLVSFVVYFVLGYLFYAALLCGIGSLANNLKEAQTLMMPVQLLLVVPLVVMVPIGRDPNGTIAQVLSWLPPFTPFVMMNRAAFPPGIGTYVGTTLLLVVSIYLALKLAARVFATGILTTGQPPRLRHVLGLLRRTSGPERRFPDRS